MPRKYTDSNFVIQTTANISAQRGKSVDQIPFSLIPFTAKSATAQNVCPSPPFGDKAYIVAQRPNPREFLFEVEKMEFAYREINDISTTATAADHVIGVGTVDDVASVQLPPAATVRSGFVLIIKDIVGNVNNNAITVSRGGSDTIDGQTSIIIDIPYASVSVVSDGGNKWYLY